ncbi:MAG TPA: SMP-30/gluconolactonase/LRE family protein, partial [Moraxellaceae bacterium]|nr:SMP-30/gluconolactonase/LRE family protein [Moraxellaceae bacterium]
SGFDDGRIVRFDARGNLIRTVSQTGGRPLGLRFHPDGSLLVCDAVRGLLRVNLPGGRTECLADEAEGVRIGFADDLDIDKAGRYVYFTDASSKWHYNEDLFDLIEHGGHGRLLRHDLKTGETTVLMRDLQFANGVTLGPDDAYVLVTETGGYRVHRYWLTGERAGSHEVWLDNLPGFPDNIRFNGHDRFWLALPLPRDSMLDYLAPYPVLRLALMQYVRYRSLPMNHMAFVLGIDLQGRVVANLQHHGDDAFRFITQVLEHEGWLYCSSLQERTLARVSLARLPVTASA